MRNHSSRRARPVLGATLATLVVTMASSCVSLVGDALDPWRPTANNVTHTTLSVGARELDTDAVAPAGHAVVGIEVDWYDVKAPVGLEVGYLSAIEDDADFQQGYLGFRRTWARSGLTPYIGAGVALMTASYDKVAGVSRRHLDFTNWGGYAHTGVYLPFGTGGIEILGPMSVGVDLRGDVGDNASSLEARVFLGFGTD